MNSNNEAIVTVEAVAKHFKSGDTLVRAVDGVSVKLPKGKLIAIKGASGSGKTTLLNMIGALDKPSEGTIVVDGTRVSEMHGGEEVSYRRKKVGFVFQSYSLIPNLTALENVMLPMEITGVEPNGRKDRARLLLQRVRIDDGQQARRPTRLSGGEQQRVAIARALANDPPIILADEPTGNLDSKTSKRIVELLYSLTQEGKTVIVATHSADIAARADMVLEMTDGKVTDTSSFERPKR